MTATCVIQPIDMVKVRIQIMGEGGGAAAKAVGNTSNPFTLGARVIQQEGVLSLYKGLSAALLRQATYTTARMGIFRKVSDMLSEDGKPLPFYKKAAAGLTAGGLGSIIGTPADVALIRMQADNTLPKAEQRGYKNVFDALIKITKTDGVFGGLFKGTFPAILRAAALNVGMLSTHDEAKEQIRKLTDNSTAITLGAKGTAGFFAAFLSLPFDFVKTRIQKQKAGPDGKLPYRSFVHCVTKVARDEGLGTFYRGFGTFAIRIAPHAMITLTVLDLLRENFGAL
jgi:hypothetical protein